MINYLRFLLKIISVNIYNTFKLSSQIPYKINFDVTYKCNSKCKICNIWKRNIDSETKSKKEMSLENYEILFKKLNEKLFIASFEGGEPFLRDDIVDIVLSAQKNCKNLISCLIASNGSLPSTIEKNMKSILKNNFNSPIYLSLSLDGLGDIHNLVRGKSDSYELVMETYDRIKKIQSPNFKFFFQTTICKTNWKNISYLIEVINEDFIFTLAHENNFFNNFESNESIFSINDIDGLIKVIKDIVKKSKLKNFTTFFNIIYLLLSINFLKRHELPIKCNASISSLSLDPYGNVSPCAFYGELFGNIIENNFSFETLLNKPNVVEIRKKIINGKCNKCWMNCDAIPSIINSLPSSFIKAFVEYFK